MLTLMNMVGFGGFTDSAPAVLTTLSLFGSATGSAGATTTAVTAPASIVAGDLMVFTNAASSGAAPTTVIPSGFTQVREDTVSATKMVASYKIANGTEGGVSQAGMAATVSWQACLYVFRGDIAITGVVVGSSAGQATAGDPTLTTLTASGGTPPLVGLGAFRGSTPAARTFTANDGSIANAAPNANVHSLFYKIYNTSPANISVDMTDEGLTNLMQSWYLQCT